MYEKPVVFDCKPESSVTVPKQEQEYPEWVIESAKEVCELDWVKSTRSFTAEALVTAKGGVGGRSLQKGFVNFDNSKIRFWWSGHGDYCFTWAKFVKFCVEKGLKEKPIKSHGLSENPEESRGKDTLRKLAEKELSRKALWTFDRNLFIFQLDFYKHSLPGGAELYRMEDKQKDEHKRYAIILQDYEFFTSGWETYEEAVESLVRYLNLK